VSMTITVNGDPHVCAEGLTVEALLREKSFSFPMRVIVVNQTIVKRDEVPTTVLHDGDVVEVVHLIGGG
jgi:sulfur carrier protein